MGLQAHYKHAVDQSCSCEFFQHYAHCHLYSIVLSYNDWPKLQSGWEGDCTFNFSEVKPLEGDDAGGI